MECLSYCIASKIDLAKLDNYYKKNTPGYVAIRSRDVLKLTPVPDESKLIFIFKNGTVVTWGIKRYQVNAYLDEIRQFADRVINFSVHDEFIFRKGDNTSIKPHDYFDVDCVTLEEDTEDMKLSFSYGFSQSVKLQYFETIIDSLIEKFTPYIQNLSVHGHMPLSRNQIQRVIGEILGAKSELNLISNFLYHPKFFWQHPTLEEYFILLERYLHMQRRVNAINHRLDTLNEIFEMFNGYLENRHAHNLEIIIIVLIAIEIIIGIIQLGF